MILLFEMMIPETVAPEEIEPIEMPCPPEQVLPVKTMLDPLLVVKQSSWFFTLLFSIV